MDLQQMTDRCARWSAIGYVFHLDAEQEHIFFIQTKNLKLLLEEPALKPKQWLYDHLKWSAVNVIWTKRRWEQKNKNIIEWVTNSYQRVVMFHHLLRDISCKDVPFGCNNRPSTCLSMDRSHDINVKRSIFWGCKKSDNDTVINVVGSSKFFHPISKKVSCAIFAQPNKMLASIVV